MSKKSVLGLLGFFALVMLIPADGFAPSNSLSEIQSPKAFEVCDHLPVEIIVRFDPKAKPETFRAMLNGRNITNKFVRFQNGARALVSKEDGLQISTGTNRHPLSQLNLIGTEIRGTNRRVDFDVRLFYVSLQQSDNHAPIANAGPDRTVPVGDVVQLDGSGSTDVDGDLLNWTWSFTATPRGSGAVLSDPHVVNPSFQADLPGRYVIQLVVNDGTVNSTPDAVTITTENSAPIANAGPDQTVPVGQRVQLDGWGSSDVDGDPLTHRWSLTSKPAASVALLVNDKTAYPFFDVDKSGKYEVQLVVNDGRLDSKLPDTVIVSTSNSSPVANAGPDQDAHVGDLVQLNGSASSDVDGDLLIYKWSWIGKPQNSVAAFSDPLLVNPTFSPDLAGPYIAQLIVNDGKMDSAPDTVNISVTVRMVAVPNVVGMTEAAARSGINAASLSVGAITQASSATVPAGSVISQNPTAGNSVSEGSPVSLVISSGPAMVTVPNVVGITQAAAQSTITAASLSVGAITQANSTTVTVGSVISQNPTAGSSVAEGSPVSLVISSGSSVPNVVGMTQAAAQSAILAANLTVGTITQANSDAVPAGNVISQNPGGGTSVPLATVVNLTISLGPQGPPLPPDPATVAPLLDKSVVTSTHAASEFLYTGASPIQTGVAQGTIEAKRAAVLRGQVTNRDGGALPGVAVTILNHPEYGQTLSRSDGMYDLAVNGGGVLTVRYEKGGYLKAQRQADVPWQDFVWLPDVTLVSFDAQATAIDLSGQGLQTARGTQQADADGTRQATLLIPPGTSAQMILPGGVTQPLTSLNIRATEYTVGPNGPKAMPAQLPPNVGYTYCVELTADEADQAGAVTVQFNQPLPYYVENFLGFPVGSIVPSGYYDRQKAAWVPSPNGRVIKIVGVSGGLADLDLNNAAGADPSLYASLGITDAERQQLATLYTVGQQLWRVPISHFTPYDLNWPAGLGVGSDATLPNQAPPDQKKPNCAPCQQKGSILECQSQVLGQEIPVTGSPFSLNYRSSHVAGRAEAYTLDIPLSGPSVPDSLGNIKLEVSVAGRLFKWNFTKELNRSHTFIWDGKDAYGRIVQGRQPVNVRIGYEYPAVYNAPKPLNSSFGSSADAITIAVGPSARQDIQYC